jgi:hypothetical protein
MMYVGLDVSSKSFVGHAINERKVVKYRGEVTPTRDGLKEMMSEIGTEKKLARHTGQASTYDNFGLMGMTLFAPRRRSAPLRGLRELGLNRKPLRPRQNLPGL